MPQAEQQTRTLGLLGATGVGVGGIVGGGIFVLAGVAFATSGPSAMIAFAVNGLVAFVTAMSFAEVSTAFPENGGAYTFAKKVLSVRSAFAVGWIVWFAYIVAGVLYALGFASFAALAIDGLWEAMGASPPAWLHGRRFALFLASAAAALYAASLIRKASGGGQLATVGKVAVFAVLLVAGLIALLRQDLDTTGDNITPFFSGGTSGLFMAMGLTFIALQGFDLIAAVGGEVKDPGRTIPRAMFLSLGCALVIYLPLLFMVSSVGVESGGSISKLAAAQPENVIPLAARRFMGTTGYWLVIVAAILSTLSALHANLLAASRVALAMARDRTLPAVLGDMHQLRRTPVMAIYATALTLVAIVFMVPDLASAGSAASLIFLVTFALVHLMTYLARRRGGTDHAGYRTPWFPVVPVVGGLACAALGVFQAVAVPDAGGIVVIWLGLGVILYWSVFARRAQIRDAASEADNPGLVSLRGRSPLVLVPIANPAQAPALVAVANALAARKVGRVLLLSIVPIAEDTESAPRSDLEGPLASAQAAVGEALRQSYGSGYLPEALVTAASDPLAEIRRVADDHQCESLLLGLGDISGAGVAQMEELINKVDANVALMRGGAGWRLEAATRILVPVGGLGDQHELRARLLGSLCRTTKREVTFVTVLPRAASAADVKRMRRSIGRLADLKVRGASKVKVLCDDDSGGAILAEAAEGYDLMVLGLTSVGRHKKVLGAFAERIARDAPCAALFLSRRRPRGFELLEPLRDDVAQSIRVAVQTGSVRSLD